MLWVSSRGSATSGRSYCIHRFRQKPVTFRLSLPTAVATARTLEQADTQRGSSCPGWVGGKAKAQSAVLAQLPISDCLIPNGRLRGALNDQCTPMPAKLNTCIYYSSFHFLIHYPCITPAFDKGVPRPCSPLPNTRNSPATGTQVRPENK